MTLQSYAIMSPVLGVNEQTPTLLLQDGMGVESVNVDYRYGAVHRARLRAPELVRIPPLVDAARQSTGSGLDDATSGGTFTGSADAVFEVEIDATGTPDTFRWRKDGGTWTAGVSITGSAQTLSDGVTITFAATTGHTLNDVWSIVAAVTSGIMRYHRLVKDSGEAYLFAFTDRMIYRWNPTKTLSEAASGTPGLDDMSLDGAAAYTGNRMVVYTVEIDATGTPDTFRWKRHDDADWVAEGVPVVSTAVTLENGVILEWAATTGHTLGDTWLVSADIGSWQEWLDSAADKPRDTGIGPVTRWSSVTYGQKVVAANGLDKVLVFDETDDAVWLDGDNGLDVGGGQFVTSARFVGVYENHLFVGYLLEAGSTLPHRIRWAAIGTMDTWDGTGSGFADIPGDGVLVTTAAWMGQLVIFKSRSKRKLWLTGGSLIFETQELSSSVGCLAPDSVVIHQVNDQQDMLFYLANDFSIRELRSGEVSYAIDRTVKQIHPDYADKVQATRIEETGELFWAIPYGGSATGNNRVIRYDPKLGRWEGYLDIPVTAFGRHGHEQTYEWDTLPFASWADWSWPQWDSVESARGFLLDLCSDADGYSYALRSSSTDNGDPFDATLILGTDMMRRQGLNINKRVLWMQPWFRDQGSGEVTIEARSDHERIWRSIGTVSMASARELFDTRLPCDILGRELELRISSQDRFEFIGVHLEFVPIGVR